MGTDNCIKTQQKLNYNSLQNIKPCNFEIGDNVAYSKKLVPKVVKNEKK